MANTKKEVDYVALKSTSGISGGPKSTIRLYQKTCRNIKRLNTIKNVIIGISVGIITKITGILVPDEWYLVLLWIAGATVFTTYLLSQIDRFVNYLLLGGVYEY